MSPPDTDRCTLPESAHTLLQVLFPEEVMQADSRINLRGLLHGAPPDTAVSRFVPSVSALRSNGYAQELADWNTAQGRSVYVAPGIRRGADGTKRGVRGITALWADLDAKAFVSASDPLTPAQRTEGKRLARQRLREQLPATLQPTYVIDTGGGLQCWWLLREPAWIGEDAYTIETLEGYLKGLAKALGGDPMVTQLAALMRLPGFVNPKYPDHPIAAILEAQNERRFTPSDFNGWFVEIPRTAPRPDIREPSGEPGPLAPVLATCGFLQWCRDHPAQVSEPLWYALLSNLVRLEGGREAAHAFSRAYPGYSVAETDAKLDHALAASGPISCAKIQADGFPDCPREGHGVKSPAGLAWTRPAGPGAPAARPTITRASLGDILAVDPGTLQTQYIVAPYVPRNGLIALTSKPGTGKTKLMLDLCLARASGGTWLGRPVEPGPALFWSGEQGRTEDFRDVQALCRGRGLRAVAQFFDVISDPPLKFGHPTMLAYVLELLAAHPGLLVGIDSIRRAFEGEDIASDVADRFFRTVLLPLRTAGATVALLAHPPKTSGTQRLIPDENMIRGSGDFAGQLDGFLVLRPLTRKRLDPDTEDIVTRLTHPKARSGGVADPRLVTMRVTQDRAPEVAFVFAGADAPAEAQATAGAVRRIALLAEQTERVGRTLLVATLKEDFGRPAVEAALKTLTGLGVLRGPLPKEERQKGERGHWFVFVKPLPPDPAPAGAADDPDEDVEEP